LEKPGPRRKRRKGSRLQLKSMMGCDLKKSILKIRKKKRNRKKRRKVRKMASTTRCNDLYCMNPHNMKDMLTSRPHTTCNKSRGKKPVFLSQAQRPITNKSKKRVQFFSRNNMHDFDSE
jgi:hypothetical protein